MNYPTLHGQQVQPRSCGRTAEETRAQVFWQSRMTTAGHRADPPQLGDLRELARQIRRGWPCQ